MAERLDGYAKDERRYKENCIERNARLGIDKKIADFQAKMKQPYEFKRNYAELRAIEFGGNPSDRPISLK